MASSHPGFKHEVPEEFIGLAAHTVGRNAVICDIGSRDALEGIVLCRMLGARECHVFEPNPVAAELCRRNILRHGAGCTMYFNEVGLSDRSGTASFYPVNAEKSTNKDIGLSSLFKVNPASTRRRGPVVQDEITIRTTTLDQYFADRPRPDLLWIDVEGAELLVFQGGERTLEHVRMIHVEVSFRPSHLGKPLYWELDADLQRRGFRLLKFMGASRLKAFIYTHKLFWNLPYRWNAVYVREA